jgi:arginase
MKQLAFLSSLLVLISLSTACAQEETSVQPEIAIVLQPYTARTGADEFSIAPQLLYDEVSPLLAACSIKTSAKVAIDLTAEEKAQYGVWHRLGLADGHLGRAVADVAGKDKFVLGLIGNCNSSIGMLAGLQHTGDDQDLQTVGMIWIDAHGDFNTPETSLSGWLGGMPVAVASGQCLHRIREKAGLNPAIETGNIIMMGLRDVDPLEQELIDKSDITTVSAEDLISYSSKLQTAVEELAGRVDVVYLHIDLDILDASDIPGSFFEVEHGPKATQLIEAIKMMVTNPKVGALGISSFPTAENGREKSLQSAMLLIEAGMQGLKERESN